jgi:hypothetical protein
VLFHLFRPGHSIWTAIIFLARGCCCASGNFGPNFSLFGVCVCFESRALSSFPSLSLSALCAQWRNYLPNYSTCAPRDQMMQRQRCEGFLDLKICGFFVCSPARGVKVQSCPRFAMLNYWWRALFVGQTSRFTALNFSSDGQIVKESEPRFRDYENKSGGFGK